MTALLPELSDDLAAAAERLAATPRRAGRRRRARFVALGTVAVLAVTGAATAATGIWRPQIGDGSQPPSLDRNAPPRAQLDALGVLRRPQTDADRGANSEYTLKFFGSLRGIRLDFVRLLGTHAGGAGYVLVPARSESPHSGRAELEALVARHHDRPPPPPTKDPLCVFARDPQGSGGAVNCFTLQDVLAGRAVMGFAAASGAQTMFGLVPDTVKRVRGGPRADAPVVDVHDNFFEIAIPAGGGPGLLGLAFLDSGGHEILRRPAIRPR